MNVNDRRTMEMITRSHGFAVEQRAVIDVAKDGAALIADLEARLGELNAQLGGQHKGMASALESGRTREECRNALRYALESVSEFAGTLGVTGLAEKFRLPKSCSDQRLVVIARAFQESATPLTHALLARGLPANVLTDLPAQIQAMEHAIAAQAAGKEAHISARAGIDAAFAAARKTLKALDAIVERGARRDVTTVAAWKNARRIGPARSKDAAAGAPTGGPTPSGSATKAA